MPVRKPAKRARTRSAGVRIFCSYAHEDERFRTQLAKHLTPLHRSGHIEIWNDRCILPGADFNQAIDVQLRGAHIVLLLVSPDFIASEYCYSRELALAMQRHNKGEAVVIPVILRAVEWIGTPMGKLRALPKDGRPIKHPTRDVALMEVAQGIREVVEAILANPQSVRDVDIRPAARRK